MDLVRRFPIGAELLPGKGTHFRVWAPARSKVEVVRRELGSSTAGERHVLEREPDGYFSALVPGFAARDLYSFRLDADKTLYPDPASRFQPEGPHGPSMVVDAGTFAWHDQAFAGTRERGQVIYEMHIGTFTRPGTYAAAAAELPELRRLGITTLEVMPVCEFPGRFGWGYDGVDLWAPTRLYGEPDDLRRFIDEAHQIGIAVILDVVYNHLGPDGNYLKCFSPDYFTDKYANEWGEPLNFDGPNSAAVREFFVQNARYWIEEFHFDGLRLDATQSIFDGSERHVIADVADAAHAAGARQGRRIFIVAENEPQHAKLVRSDPQGGLGCDALWNDDFHHTAKVALTGRREAYFQDYGGSPQELISALKWGYLYQGQHYFWQGKRRGTPALGLPATAFVTYIQNHDQLANSLNGARLDALTSRPMLRAMTGLMLLAPPTPMLFQGQEFAASSPFLYFADHNPELMEMVNRGRKEFLAQFPSVAQEHALERLTDASDPATFERSKLDFSERETHRDIYDLHRDLLALRATDPAFSEQRADHMHGAVLSPLAFLLRFICDRGDRLIVVNLGPDLELHPAPEPLLVAPDRARWKHVWSSEHPKYGGTGYQTSADDGVWKLTAHSTSVFFSVPEDDTGEE